MFDKLAAPFPKQEIRWRAQTLTRDGDKALALAYIDARDVMRRLDEVAGPGGWSDSYIETRSGRVICSLAIFIDGHWISKSDGAGDTAVEGEKGGLSDAFKRAAVKWGIGRYLYALGKVWAPCETYEAGGKKRWKEWTDDPWKFVRGGGKFSPSDDDKDAGREIAKIHTITSAEELFSYWKVLNEVQKHIARRPDVIAAKNERKAVIGGKEVK